MPLWCFWQRTGVLTGRERELMVVAIPLCPAISVKPWDRIETSLSMKDWLLVTLNFCKLSAIRPMVSLRGSTGPVLWGASGAWIPLAWAPPHGTISNGHEVTVTWTEELQGTWGAANIWESEVGAGLGLDRKTQMGCQVMAGWWGPGPPTALPGLPASL